MVRSVGAILVEALEELGSNLTRYTVVGVALVCAFAIPAAAEMDSVQSRTMASQGLRAEGALVWVARGDTDFAGQRCRSLSDRPDVVRAGGFATQGTEELLQAPGVLVQFVVADRGALQVWEADQGDPDQTGSVVVGGRLASQLGLVAGSVVSTDSAVLEIDGVASTGVRDGPADRWVLTPFVSVRTIEECWIELAGDSAQPEVAIDEVAADLRRAVANVVVAPNDPAALIEYLIERDGFESRPSQHYWVISAALAGTALTAALLLSRNSIALVMALGTSRVRVVATYSIVGAALVVSAAAIALVVASAVATIRLDHPLLAATTTAGRRTVVLAALIAVATVPLVTLTSTARSLASALKDR